MKNLDDIVAEIKLAKLKGSKLTHGEICDLILDLAENVRADEIIIKDLQDKLNKSVKYP